MSFRQDPIVDKNAERSQESVTKCLGAFSKKNGFISHQIDGTDDYGVDINCQLIIENQATPHQFPIQVKSQKTYKSRKYRDKKYKTASFSTSRLGHLIRHTPVSGIIFIYEEETETSYYQFAFEVYNLVRVLKVNDEWEDQETVTILIPIENKVNKLSVNALHARLKNLFEQHGKLINEHGSEYGLPNTSEVPEKGKSPFDLLSEYGELMFNTQMFPQLIQLLERLDRKSARHQQMCYLGALAYAEVGNILEADYNFKLCDSIYKDFTPSHQEVLEFQRFKLEFYSGKLSKTELRKLLAKTQKLASTKENQLHLEIASLQLQLSDFFKSGEPDYSLLTRVNALYDEVELQGKQNSTYYLQLVSLSDILGHILGGILLESYMDTKVLEGSGVPINTPERRKKVEFITSMYSKGFLNLTKAIDYATEKDDKTLLAHALFSRSTSFFGQCFASFTVASKPDDLTGTKNLLSAMMSGTVQAYNIFSSLQMEPLAYRAITLCYELHKLAELWISFDMNEIIDLTTIIQKIDRFKQLDFSQKFESIVEKSYQERIEIFEKHDRSDPVKLREEHILTLAKAHARQHGLPSDRVPNIVDEMKSSKLFEQRNQNNDLVLKVKQVFTGESAYKERSKYAIVSKTTDIIYSEG